MNFGSFPVVRGYSREQGIAQLLDFQRSVVTPNREYAHVRYPAGIGDLIDAVMGTGEVDANLVALACLGALAAADRGVHRVLYPNDESMPLSFFALAGADSGYGKSTSLRPFLTAFRDYEKLNNDVWELNSAKSEVVSTVKSHKMVKLCKQISKKDDYSRVDEASKLLIKREGVQYFV